MTTAHKINKLFRELRKQGCKTARNACCNSCAWATYDGEDGGCFVFTNSQAKGYIYGNYPENICDLMQQCGLSRLRPTEDRETTAIYIIV